MSVAEEQYVVQGIKQYTGYQEASIDEKSRILLPAGVARNIEERVKGIIISNSHITITPYGIGYKGNQLYIFVNEEGIRKMRARSKNEKQKHKNEPPHYLKLRAYEGIEQNIKKEIMRRLSIIRWSYREKGEDVHYLTVRTTLEQMLEGIDKQGKREDDIERVRKGIY